jgi:hypothetical protein
MARCSPAGLAERGRSNENFGETSAREVALTYVCPITRQRKAGAGARGPAETRARQRRRHGMSTDSADVAHQPIHRLRGATTPNRSTIVAPR